MEAGGGAPEWRGAQRVLRGLGDSRQKGREWIQSLFCPTHSPPTTAQPIGMTVPLSLKIAAAYSDPFTHLFSHSPQNWNPNHRLSGRRAKPIETKHRRRSRTQNAGAACERCPSRRERHPELQNQAPTLQDGEWGTQVQWELPWTWLSPDRARRGAQWGCIGKPRWQEAVCLMNAKGGSLFLEPNLQLPWCKGLFLSVGGWILIQSLWEIVWSYWVKLNGISPVNQQFYS